MRVALITREYPPETSWGGIGTHYFAFARGLRAAGCEVEVFTQGLNATSRRIEDGVVVHRVVPRKWAIGRRHGGPLGGGSLSSIGLFCIALAKEMQGAFAKVHGNRPFNIVEGHEHLGTPSLIHRRFRRSLVTVTRYQTAYHSMVSRRMANWPRSRLVQQLERYAIRAADYRIATSQYVDDLTRYDFPGTPTADAIIPNLTPFTDLSASSLSLSQREPLVIFVGRMMPGHKNPDMAAAAFARLADRYPDWRIEFAGENIPLDKNETMWDRCRRILDRFPGRYAYHGVLSYNGLRTLYARARVLIVPSMMESYGLVALEAMSLGCVPIVSNGTALPDVVGDAGLVFDSGSLGDLVAKLDFVLGSESEQRRRAEACVRRVRSEFDSVAIVKRNLSAFSNWFSSRRP